MGTNTPLQHTPLPCSTLVNRRPRGKSCRFTQATAETGVAGSRKAVKEALETQPIAAVLIALGCVSQTTISCGRSANNGSGFADTPKSPPAFCSHATEDLAAPLARLGSYFM